MTTDNAVRVLAGVFVLTSIALSRYVHPNWIWLGVFVGINLIQSAFTGFCPAEMIFKKLGFKPSCSPR
jgi:Protein of unknown function (DUF2892)